MPSFKIIGLLVLEKIFKVFLLFIAMACDLDHLYKLPFTLPKNAPHKVWFDWPSGFRDIMVIHMYMYINFVELQSLMLHTKFQNHWPSGSGEEDFNVFSYL